MSDPASPRRCPGCFLRPHLCLCAEVPRLETRTEVVIVRHFRELYKASSSARLVAAAMPRCRVIDYGLPHQPFDPTCLPQDAWLLFPPERDQDGHETDRHRLLYGVEHPPPPAIVILDGTWAQARRMSHRIRALDAYPRYQLGPAPEPLRRLRRAPTPRAVSTLEAVAQFLRSFDDPAHADALEALYTTFAYRLRCDDRWGR